MQKNIFRLDILIKVCYYTSVVIGGVIMRENIIYRCNECGEENYIGTKDKKKHPDRVEIQKYCKRCQKKTAHKEKK